MPHAVSQEVDLYAPLERDVILEVRTGRMKTLPGASFETGIDKTICEGPMWVGKLGIEGDEHDMTFHGGIDKAVHGFHDKLREENVTDCSSHYPSWQAEFPSASTRFVPGGFGENLVTARMNERNICIGDTFAIGSGEHPLLLQVSLPRQPCYKLNHRFKLKSFAPNTWRFSRTGWYYRVLREGPVQAGDEIVLRERPWPEWTIERIQEYLHRHTDNAEMNKALSEVAVMGDESRKQFTSRVERAEMKNARPVEIKWLDYRVVEKRKQTPRVTSFVFERVNPADANDDEDMTEALHGHYVKLRLQNGLTRAYSITFGNRLRFELGIALDENSRGGSKYLHAQVDVNSIVQVGSFASAVKFNNMATHQIFVVGGVGLTAFLGLIEAVVSINWTVQLHYAVRSADDIAFRSRLEQLGMGDRVIIYDKSQDQRLSIDKILQEMPWNSHLYFCGPPRLLAEAASKTKLAGIPDSEVHFEAFTADVGGDPFEVSVFDPTITTTVDDDDGDAENSNNKVLKVAEDETLLDVLKRDPRYAEFPSSCEVGNCGTCRVRVRCGKVEHRGTALTEDEKKEGVMLACVSRGLGRIEIEIDF